MNRYIATLLGWMVCRALPIGAVVLPAALLAQQLGDVHWAYRIAFWLLLLTGLLLLLLHLSTHTAPHPGCDHPTKSAEALARRRYRLVLAYSRLAPYVGIACVLVLAALPLVRDPVPDGQDTHISLPYSAGMTCGMWVVLSLVAARVFQYRHADYLPERGLSPAVRRLAERLRSMVHRSHWLVVGAVVFEIVVLFVVPAQGPWSTFYGLASIVLVLTVVGDFRHSDDLCEACVAEFRVDAPEYAASKRWAFGLLHKGTGPYLATAAVLLLAGFVFEDSPVGLGARCVLLVSMCATTFLNRFHRAYQPWCPYCHPGDGGGDHHEVPDPTGGHPRPLPV